VEVGGRRLLGIPRWRIAGLSIQRRSFGIFVAAAIGMATFGSVSVAGDVLRAGYHASWPKATHPAAPTVRSAAPFVILTPTILT